MNITLSWTFFFFLRGRLTSLARGERNILLLLLPSFLGDDMFQEEAADHHVKRNKKDNFKSIPYIPGLLYLCVCVRACWKSIFLIIKSISVVFFIFCLLDSSAMFEWNPTQDCECLRKRRSFIMFLKVVQHSHHPNILNTKTWPKAAFTPEMPQPPHTH